MDDGTWTIRGGGLTARFIALGATLWDLRLDGHDAPLTLGLADRGDYPGRSSFMGATAGRMANRIGGARFTVDGVEHRTDPNFLDRHTLHGGSAGMGKRDWRMVEHGERAIVFAIEQADGDMGFPGRLTARARFALTEGAVLRVDYEAEADAPTPCNLAHHSYWMLDDGCDVASHGLTVDADRYTPVDDEMIPTGEAAPVEGTRFDFRAGRRLTDEGLLDHNLCLSDGRGPLREVAVLRSERSGVAMRLATTEPGLQVYDGAKLKPGLAGTGGRIFGPRGGVALEPQVWPDAMNHAGFPPAVLRPGETYRQTTTFTFSKGQSNA